MSIRLNKVTRDLNVGIQTVATFLRKKGFEIELNPNTKITDEQYNLLVKEFSTDKDLKIESERISQERQKEKKAAQEDVINEPQEIETVIDESLKPHIKAVGKIDLDNLHKKAEEPKNHLEEETTPSEETGKAEETVESFSESHSEPLAETEEEIVSMEEAEIDDTVEAEPEKEEISEPTNIENEKEMIPENADEEKSEEKEEAEIVTPRNEEIFKLNTVKTPGINVVGKIDLSAINQQTRPKKKSKEEKRKEREAKEKQRNTNI